MNKKSAWLSAFPSLIRWIFWVYWAYIWSWKGFICVQLEHTMYRKTAVGRVVYQRTRRHHQYTHACIMHPAEKPLVKLSNSSWTLDWNWILHGESLRPSLKSMLLSQSMLPQSHVSHVLLQSFFIRFQASWRFNFIPISKVTSNQMYMYTFHDFESLSDCLHFTFTYLFTLCWLNQGTDVHKYELISHHTLRKPLNMSSAIWFKHPCMVSSIWTFV